jgi:peroxiredoxin
MRNILLVLILTIFCLQAKASTIDISSSFDRNEIADFTLQNLKGKDESLSDYDGHVIIITFWATWCGPCKQELSFLNKYYKKFKNQGFTVLAISTDAPETRAMVRMIAKRKKWKMPIMFDDEGSVTALLNPRGAVPFSLFVDKNRKSAYLHEGYTLGDEIKYLKIIKSLLKE